MHKRLVLVAAMAVAPAFANAEPAVQTIGPTTNFENDLKPTDIRVYALPMLAGESADVAVVQEGIDVQVELRAPGGALLNIVDSPNGRNGDEPVEIIADAAGAYQLRVQAIGADEPAGKYRLEVRTFRDAHTTAQMMDARRQAREAASTWLRVRSDSIPPSGVMASGPLAHFDALAARVRVLGLGEATHGSREFGDLRFSLTRRLVERGGYRIVALEASADRMTQLQPYIDGKPLDAAYEKLVEYGWIGRRTTRALVEWSRTWNLAHPRDRLRVVGVDAQDNAWARRTLADFLTDAYGPDVASRWKPADAELAAADEQTAVFGNSDVNATSRTAAIEAFAQLNADAAILARRFGRARFGAAQEAARILAQFADFNGGGAMINHGRDWYMAVNVLRALEAAPADARAVYWAHNAHVVHPTAPSRTTGAILRQALGCGYGAVGVTFGQGAFVAQIPNDLEDRLAASELPVAPAETIEGVVAAAASHGGLIATWACEDTALVPAWMKERRAMHWVGGLYTPGTPAFSAYRSYFLTADFDGIAYLPRVTADMMPTDRPLIPARPRQ